MRRRRQSGADPFRRGGRRGRTLRSFTCDSAVAVSPELMWQFVQYVAYVTLKFIFLICWLTVFFCFTMSRAQDCTESSTASMLARRRCRQGAATGHRAKRRRHFTPPCSSSVQLVVH
eukprot:6211089-Pleurochrysis_carterae.AAC.6